MRSSIRSASILAGLISLLSSFFAGLLVPQHLPKVHDEFAHLLAAETFASGRLTNPSHPFERFFESPHILTTPTYMSKYPPGHGLFIALGVLIGKPIAGVWVENAVFVAALTWMLRVFMPLRWSLLGGAFAILQLGLIHTWTQAFWAVPLAAAGGALVFGGSWQLLRNPNRGASFMLGLGIVLLAVSRPFEGLLSCIIPALLLGRKLWSLLPAERVIWLKRWFIPAAAVAFCGGLFLAYYNYRVVGSWTKLPYSVYEDSASGAPLFRWQDAGPKPEFRNDALKHYFESFISPITDNPDVWWRVWPVRIKVVFDYYLGPALTLILLPAVFSLRMWTVTAVTSIVVASILGTASLWFSPHYFAPHAPLLFLLAAAGARKLAHIVGLRRARFTTIAVMLCSIQFTTIVVTKEEERSVAYHSSVIPYHNVVAMLTLIDQPLLLFVRINGNVSPHSSWVYNQPDINNSKLVWAWDRGPDENKRLIEYFSYRQPIIVNAHNNNPTIESYAPSR